jgi:ribose transport system substrate-binding protein
VVGEQDDPSDDISGGQQAMSGLLGKFGTIDGVLAYNDESAVGAYTAMRSEGRKDFKVDGINGSSLGLSALESGRVSAIVQVDAVDQGGSGASWASELAAIKGGELSH